MAANQPPPGIDLTEDQGQRIVSSMVALIVLPTLAVIARLLSRYLAHAGFWYDDLWVVISLLLSYGPIICVLISQGTNGFGRHIWALQDPKFTNRFLEILYIYAILFYLSSTAIKICLLLFYRRIFPVRELKLALQIAMGIVIAYFIGSVLSLIFQCAPVDKYWNREKPGSCVNGDIVLIVPGAINVKSVLTGVFVCAGFVCIISIIRMVVLSRLHQADVTWNFVNSAIWSAAEPCMGVVSACIPSLRPLVALITRGTHKVRSQSSDRTSNSGAYSKAVWGRESGGESGDDSGDGVHFQRLTNPLANKHHASRWGRNVSVRGGKDMERGGLGGGDEVSLQEMNVPEGQIKIKEEITITSSDWLEYDDRVY
ncbi:MAG: hypothetical protein L6R35_001206 [Caloplaca aegaea]|nr:MAG: hypothetical protein L6R35_001206 [Caloplaca aegaea]